ncbi:uncharacterized protein TRAVEDRAFT_53601 [Trametes versicolor FP-101664 SS1]|uniref:uncharacterized protein n=1 Tax=Trametes versicolor (strain FP-101664) TaxID=717944 RepID=UPI0004621725|nr:uncharacterized protein TRAVEDRAFT_53601 [Trametes versicolor FP-101664 SS1]EIW52176.1 hypothetical protein TRAVEDRAFT_53601 [Trametes versicolor FP-101664 SS1]
MPTRKEADNDPDEERLSKRPRKPTERGQLYAQARSEGAKKNTKTREKALPPTQGKNVSAAKPQKTSTSASKGNAQHAGASAAKSKRRHDEFRIETLPTNRTSEKANPIDMHARARALPRTSDSEPAASRAAADKASAQRQQPERHSSASTSSRRLTQESAAKLAALRNPQFPLSPAPPGPPDSLGLPAAISPFDHYTQGEQDVANALHIRCAFHALPKY